MHPVGRNYGSVIVDENGEFIIPLELRQELNIKPGDRFLVLADFNEKSIVFISPDNFHQLQLKKGQRKKK